MLIWFSCSWRSDISHQKQVSMALSHDDCDAVSYLWKWSHLSHCPWSMANWQSYLGPILCTAPHAVMGSGQLLCRDQAGCIEREGGLSTIWWSKILRGLILGHQLLYHHMTGTWLSMLSAFLTALWRQHVGYVTVSLGMHIWPFQSILNRAASIIFIKYKSGHITP